MTRKDCTVVALGGNALIRARERGLYSDQLRNIRATAAALVNLIEQGHRLVLTHGNGPQVGNLLIQQEMANDTVPPMPLDVCGAQSQGQIGYMLQQALRVALAEKGLSRQIGTVITQVLVQADSPALQNPTKPVGPFYQASMAETLRRERGWHMVEDSNRGYRRVVPSPEPYDIVEKEIICRLFGAGVIVIASGGGGVPVVQDEQGRLTGVEAVIDKDRAVALLATLLKARLLLILTDADRVALNYGTPQQQDLTHVTVNQLKQYAADGHFPPGSMGPKIEGALRFLEQGGERVIITRPELAATSLAGEQGTHITPD